MERGRRRAGARDEGGRSCARAKSADADAADAADGATPPPMASLSKRLGVPLITLYLIAGSIFGAACAGLGIAAPPAVQSVTAALHNACLALITVAAGCELDPEALRSNARTIRATVVALCVSAPLVVGGAYLLLLPRATAADDAALQAVVALFCGVIAIARSPSFSGGRTCGAPSTSPPR